MHESLISSPPLHIYRHRFLILFNVPKSKNEKKKVKFNERNERNKKTNKTKIIIEWVAHILFGGELYRV